MHTYYISMECPNCDAEIFYGPCATLIEHKGLPVISADHASQERFDCTECDASVYVGGLDTYSPDDEGGDQ